MAKFQRNIYNQVLRAIIEVGSVIFLFYSNLLMGEFTHSNSTPGKTFSVAINDIFTEVNFSIAIITGIIGYAVFEFLRKKFR
jgi:hypothetical protein